MAAKSFLWLSIGGGAWAIAANWDDLTDAQNPSGLVPGAQDSVSVTGSAGSAVATITGSGLAGAAQFLGNTALAGTFTFGTLTVGLASGGGLLQLATGASVLAGNAELAAGSMLANGTGTMLGVAGTLTLGSLQSDAAATVNVTGGGHAEVANLLLAGLAAGIFVDPGSSLEVGTAGGAATGCLTVDAGARLVGQGNADQFGAIVNQGTVVAEGGTLALGTLSGAGSLVVLGGATLELNGFCPAGQTLAFLGANGTLALSAEAYAPAGPIRGFLPGDSIDFLGSPVAAASYATGGGNIGTLTLYYGTQVAARLTLAGNYTGDVFLISGDGGLGTLIGVAQGSSGGGSPSPGTASPDQYLWVAAGSGGWNSAANWQDQTTGARPAAIAPGLNDSVTIAATAASFTVIGGPANAAALAITGEVALSGSYSVSPLSIGTAGAAGFTGGTLDLLAGTVLEAGSATIAAGAIAVAGSGAVLSVAGTLTMGGGLSGVGLPVTALTATAGGTIRAAALTLGGGSGNSITTDPTGVVEVGTLGGAMAGAVTVDPGATLAGNGSVNPLGTVIDNGTIEAVGGVLVLGSVSGTGALAIAAGAGLDLNATTALPIAFAGAGASLGFAGAAASPTGPIAGLVPGDVIDFLGNPLTAAILQTANASLGGTLNLVYDTTLVASLVLAGNLAGDRFALLPDGQGGTDITVVAVTGGTGGGGQTGTDQLSWNSLAGGNWSRAANWLDVTTGTTATLPPGAQTPAMMAGPTGAAFQTVAGTGTCLSLGLTGNSDFWGSFAIGTLTVGQVSAGTATASGSLITSPHTTLSLGTAAVEAGAAVAEGSGARIDIAGTLSLGGGNGGSTLAALALGQAQLGGLALAGGTVTVDTLSSVEIGTLGLAAAGAITVDPGFAVAGAGRLGGPSAAIVDNGGITAQGGTLTLGAVGGSGTLAIGTEAVLTLTGACACPIAFAGAGATLDLAGTAEVPGSVIAGFAPGCAILTGSSPVAAITYLPGTGAPGSGGIGTLTLWENSAVAGTLLLAGNFSGDAFAVQPSGLGAAITVAPATGGGAPPAGTVAPDAYLWTGAASRNWADAGNWSDVTAAQAPAELAPGQNDRITIAAGGAPLTIAGPANAAALALSGTVSLTGSFGIGTLTLGSAASPGMLALADGDNIAAASGTVTGGIAAQGGTLSFGGALVLGEAGGTLAAAGDALVQAAILSLDGPLSTVATGSKGAIEIGGTAAGAAGEILVDAAGTLSGAGTVGLGGTTVDNGLIVAAGGTLALGDATGTGTLLVGIGAELALTGTAGAGLTVDFAAAGTLDLPNLAGFSAGILDFGPSDAVVLPGGGATGAVYVETGPGTGVVTIFAGGTVMAELTFLGSVAGEAFAVAPGPQGTTILSATPANTAGAGGGTMSANQLAPGLNPLTWPEFYAYLLSLAPTAAQDMLALSNAAGNPPDYAWYLNGTSEIVDPPQNSNPGLYAEVIGPITATYPPPGFGPGADIQSAPGYRALIAEGSEDIALRDVLNGNMLLVGNGGNDIILDNANNDTLVGGAGGRTLFITALDGGTPIGTTPNAYIHGGGRDTIVAGIDNVAVTTSGAASVVFLGAANNSVASAGHDVIVCGGFGNNNANDTVTAITGATDTVFGPVLGQLVESTQGGAAVVVGTGGQIAMYGGSGNGSVLWADNSNTEYFGGSGTAVIVGGSNSLLVQGGSGALVVWGGSGKALIEGAAGPSTYIVGDGATTISAGAGNSVWLVGAAPVTVFAAPGVVVNGQGGFGADVLQANAGPETLRGGAGFDTFFDGHGNGAFFAGSGPDVFNFTNGAGGGNDTIFGFHAGADTIALRGFGGAMPAIAKGQGNSYITFADGTHLTVAGVTNLTMASFTFS